MIANYVGGKYGICVEIFSGKDMLLEVFRDDTAKTRGAALYKNNLDLELVEQTFTIFKKLTFTCEKPTKEALNYIARRFINGKFECMYIYYGYVFSVIRINNK